MTTLEAIKFDGEANKLLVLDQLRLPLEHQYDEVSTCEEAFDCIKSMRVRGAPAIAIVAALALVVELKRDAHLVEDERITEEQLIAHIDSRLDYLGESRPTAVDLSNAITRLKAAARGATSGENLPVRKVQVVSSVSQEACIILERDLQSNKAIGRFGVQWLQQQFQASPSRPLSVLTHCNTGSLATSGHGTALGIVRDLHAAGILLHAFCTETRPYNQGSRLTAFELVHDGIPSTLITDSMAGALMAGQQRRQHSDQLAAVIVGADRVARNGDTANKIGTYALAVLARHHGLKFVVAAPTTSLDLSTVSGAVIKIEERKPEEVTQITGAVVGADASVGASKTQRVAIADQRIGIWNPGFDVTPHALIDAIVTEQGVLVKGPDGKFDFAGVAPERWEATKNLSS